MKFIFFIPFIMLLSLQAQELKIVANSFDADEKKGITVFNGDVKITKGFDKLNAQVVKVFTDSNHTPTKYIANGKVTFYIKSENNAIYQGKAGKAIFYPLKKEYHFYTNVNIKQLDQKKQIIGEEVVINTVAGTAKASGGKKGPVIMTFELQEETKK